MSTLHYSILVITLILADGHVRSSSADQQPESISAIIQSYADAFKPNSPLDQQRITEPIHLNVKVRDPGFVFDFTTFKPIEQQGTILPAYSNIELKEVDYNNGQKNVAGVTDLSAEESEEDGDPKGPPDHIIPHSEHENPKEPSTRPNYTAPGGWAKPRKDKDIPLDFVPSKLYAQVRGTHTVKQLPRQVAINSAETDEEKENAARLKEVVKISKANTIYTEEGYEDAAYDHAGQIRDADFHEGYARKLKEELDKKTSQAGNGYKPKSFKKHKPRKNKSRNFDNFSDDCRDDEEINEETRTSKKQIKPENLNALKSALNQPIIDSKKIVESGVKQLEEDLRKESYEAERTSTEPYSVTTTTTNKPPVIETTTPNKIEYETTTQKRDIYTLRPRKLPTIVRPKSYLAKIKRPKYYSGSKNNDNNYNDYLTNLYTSESPTTINYSNLFWQYFLNKQNETPAVTYRPVYSETQNGNPVIANPLAIATVNGHGPYLVAVPSPPNTSSPLESENVETTIHYVASATEPVTQPTLASTYIEHSPFLVTEARKIEVTSELVPEYSYPLKKHNDNPKVYKEEEKRISNKSFTYPQFKPTSNHEKMLDYLKNEKPNYYKVMQPPRVSDVLVTYPDYSRGPYGNVLEQWSMTHESERPVESVYDVMELAEHPRVEPAALKSALPVTRLLPPAPLSSSEYASFHIREKKIDPIPPSVMAIMPIIEAIHKKESNHKSFPFLFRKKRSALGHTREWEIAQRDRKLLETELSKIADASSVKNENKTSNIKYPKNFKHLLNESPHIATDIVNKEIQERFKDDSKESSKKGSSEASDENSKGSSNEDSKASIKEDLRNKNTVEVEVPELDLSDIFEKDEPEPTTKKPSIDVEKYPFYRNNKVLNNSPLKYIMNPMEVPKKTLGGMEFYDSRNLECEEIDPNLEKLVPEEEKLVNKHGPRKGKQRLYGLGDKVDCFKAKYFDENPLDNPLFFEKEIGAPSPPSELDPKTFASRILELPPESDKYIIPRGPKTPEEFIPINQRQVTLRNIPRQYISGQSVHYNYALHPKKSGFIPNHHQKNQGLLTLTADGNKSKLNKMRSRSNAKKSNLKISPAYQRQVYEDVMGTIMNLENMNKTPKRGSRPLYSKHNTREYDREQEYTALNTKHRRPMSIDGLVPPPQHSYTIPSTKNNKFAYSNARHNRHTLRETPIQTFRIFKRSIDADNIKEFVNSFNQTNNNSDNIDNNNYKNYVDNIKNSNVKKKNEQSVFRIILTTQSPEKRKRKRKTVTIVTEEPVIPITQRTIYTISNHTKHSNRSSEDIGKYDKFVDNENQTLSVDIRRQEPRYNISRRRHIINNVSITTSSPIKSELPTVTSQASADPPFSGSTLIPVIVKPDENFTTRIPQESKNTYTKQKLKKSDDNEPQEPSNDYKDEVGESTEKSLKNSETQYLVHENTQENPKDEKSDEILSNVTLGPDSQEEHKELFEFLEGDPPGYNETFKNEDNPKSDESKSKESLHNEESNEDNTNEEVDRPEEEESSKEKYVGVSTLDDGEEETQESVKDEEENSSTTSSKPDDKPFVRFSSRPYSPPENYEDDRYSDLGPRVNKPYFYHPSFELPEYERRTLGKVVDPSDSDEWGHTEESVDHDKYVFPWEKNEEEEKGDESQYYSTLGRYEYPWERRERKEKERKTREKLGKKYGKNHFESYEGDDEDEDGKEATNTKPIYFPHKFGHSRGKKDVNNVQVSLENRPTTKFSSKYKSNEAKVPLENDETLITATNNDKTIHTINNYLEKLGVTAPKIKTSQTLQKRILNDTYSVSSTTNLPTKLNRKNETARSEPSTNSTTSNPKSLRSNRTTATPPLTSSMHKQQTRVRSRKIRTRVNITSDNSDKIKLSDQSTEQTSTTAAPRTARRRGRTRDTSRSATVLTTISPIKFVSRRRNRPMASAEIQTVASTTSRTPHERRRRPFRISSSAEKNTDGSKSDQGSYTTLSSVPTSTGRTIEHHSRVSKEEIITKTFYPDEDDDDEDDSSEENQPKKGKNDDEDDSSEENQPKKDNVKSASEKKPVTFSKLKRRINPKNESQDDYALKKEKVEKVTITMEETPEHVYRTKEIDKDGVKGKFVTITANNNSTTSSKPANDLRSNDPEIEEIKRKMNAFNSFDSVIRDTEDLTDEASGSREAENYLLGNLLQKLPLPTARGPKVDAKEDNHLSDSRESEDDDDDDDSENEDDDDKDNDDDDNDDDNDNGNDESNKNAKEEKDINESNVAEKRPVAIIKDPNNRRYFYVQRR